MLIEFSVENFKSIKDEVTFSMLASTDKEKPENIFNTDMPSLKDDNFLKSAVIFGPNASGKSNLIEVLFFLSTMILNSHKLQLGDKIPVVPYKFDQSYLSKPSKFNIIFVSEGTKFSYSVSLDEDRIYEESLYYWKTVQPTMVFDRKYPDKFKINSLESTKKDKLKQEIYLEETLDNILFLSQATKLKHPIATKAYNWFRNNLKIKRDPGLRSNFTTKMCLKDTTFKEKILKYLAYADFGIKNFSIQTDKVPFDNIPFNLKNSLSEKLSKKDNEAAEIKDIELEIFEIKTYHDGKDVNGNPINVELEMSEESNGTILYYNLIGPILNILEKGYILVVDELDSNLHPLLVEYIIHLFHNHKINKNNAQLIFTTHNVQLFEANLFRRDQIWFMEKSKESESTDLFSLSDINGVRKDLNLRKGYLLGRFGAIPYINKGSLLCPE